MEDRLMRDLLARGNTAMQGAANAMRVMEARYVPEGDDLAEGFTHARKRLEEWAADVRAVASEENPGDGL